MSQMTSGDLLDAQRGRTNEPLSEKDLEFINRILADPSVFPREFKRWVTEHASDTVDIAKTQVHGLVNNSGQVVIGSASVEMMGAVLCGFVMGWPGAVAPAGWLLCDGREVLRSDYVNLFAMIGTSAGTPSDGTKFKLPDYRDRALYGVGSIVGLLQSDGVAAGSRGGPSHHHVQTAHVHYFIDTKYHEFSGGGSTDTRGNHDHTYQRPGSSSFVSGGSAGGTFGAGAQTGATGDHAHNFSVTVGGNVQLAANTQSGGGGPTSGGGAQDRPSWAGINFIMGSGKVPA